MGEPGPWLPFATEGRSTENRASGGIRLFAETRGREQQASWCSLGVARSRLHVIPHRPAEQAGERAADRLQKAELFSQKGGCIYIGYLVIIGSLELPPQKTPPFSSIPHRKGGVWIQRGGGQAKPQFATGIIRLGNFSPGASPAFNPDAVSEDLEHSASKASEGSEQATSAQLRSRTDVLSRSLHGFEGKPWETSSLRLPVWLPLVTLGSSLSSLGYRHIW